jgi:hypothetical protein
MSEQIWLGSQIEKWDEESMRVGFKVGPVERPSTFPCFWNEAQAEKWVEDGMPEIDSFKSATFPHLNHLGDGMQEEFDHEFQRGWDMAKEASLA